MNERLLKPTQIGAILGLEKSKIPTLYFRLEQMGKKRQKKDGVAAYVVSHDDIEKLREIYADVLQENQYNSYEYGDGEWVTPMQLSKIYGIHHSTIYGRLATLCEKSKMIGRSRHFYLTKSAKAELESLAYRPRNEIVPRETAISSIINDDYTQMLSRANDENKELQQKICDLEYENSRLKERIAELESAKNVEVCVKNESELDKQIKLKQLEIFQKVLG